MSAPDIFSPEYEHDPYPFYKIFRDDFPLFYHEGLRSYVISRHEDVSRFLKDPVFSTRNYASQIEPVHGRTMLQMDGREHARLRSLLTPAFRGRELRERFVPAIEGAARELIDAFRAYDEVDLIEAFTKHFPINVLAEILGLPRSDHDRFRAWYGAIVAFFQNVTGDPAVVEAGLRTRRELAEYILPIIAERRQRPGDDLLSVLCSAEVDGVRLADDEIRAFVSLLIAGGAETTDKALALTIKNLVAHPDQLEAVRRDRSLIDRAFAETLRFSPPAHMMMRVPLEDVEMQGGTVPANAMVTGIIGAANRDERQFSRPDVFDILREDLDPERAFTGAANHVAFGLGRHFCAGAVLAKTEVQLAVNQLLDAMHEIRFADGAAPPDHGIFVRAPRALRLRFTPAPGAADLS